MDDSLEALLEKATNPKNKYEDWEFIMCFCDQVNGQADGPIVALRIIPPKLRDSNEKVALLALTLLEACVKNCGQRFHTELGKFRFLNELIRLISPKYLGGQTPEPVQTKVKQLLFSWKLGLPHEPKIQEAYEMLKKEGLIFDESVGPDKTLELIPSKPKVNLVEDPRQSRMLQKLLASKNPDDLRAANRLIREMVRRDEKRMQKLQKRLDELEHIQNNVKLFNELLSHYKPETGGEDEKQLITELYKSLEKLRPNLFRMASELKQNEQGMSEILQTNDSVLRSLDQYRKIFGEVTDSQDTSSTTPASTTTTVTATTTTSTENTASGIAMTTSGGASGGGSSSDVLIDLADLNFGPPPVTTPTAGQPVSTGDPSSMGSLLDDLGALNLAPIGSTPTSAQNFPNFSMPPQMMATSTQQQQPTPPQLGGAFPLLTSPPPAMAAAAAPPPSSFQPSSFITLPPPPSQPHTTPSTSSQQPQQVGSLFGSDILDLGNLSLGLNKSPEQPVDPLAVLDSTFVALDTIQPGTLPPLQVMSKGNVSVNFHFAKNSPAPNVIVVVVSIISTSAAPITNFQLQAAVPKVMRVKLQPPTSVEMSAYNPIQPPPSISQVMLLANPSKAKVRMKYRISYNLSGLEVVEMGEVADFPVI